MGKNPEYKDWEEKELAANLNRFPERKEKFANHGGEEIERLAVPDQVDDEYLEKIGFPGRYPYTRGVQPTMYRGRLWTMRQYAGFSTGIGIKPPLPVFTGPGNHRSFRSL